MCLVVYVYACAFVSSIFYYVNTTRVILYNLCIYRNRENARLRCSRRKWTRRKTIHFPCPGLGEADSLIRPQIMGAHFYLHILFISVRLSLICTSTPHIVPNYH